MAQLELEQLHQDMLDAISNRYQKTAGFPAYDFTRAFALAILSLASDIEAAEAHLNVDNLSGAELDEYIRQRRAMERKYATFAEVTMTVTSGGGEIHAGDLFSTASGVEFQAITDGTYNAGDYFTVRAVVAGTSGNVPRNTITYMPVTIPGVGSVTNYSKGTGGAEGETDDEFRDRFYASMHTPANGSNAQSYVDWAMSVPGVGRAVAARHGTYLGIVYVYILDQNIDVASSELQMAVQELFDPNENGDGSGVAPLGIGVGVASAWGEPTRVSVHIEVQEGWDADSVKADVQENIFTYFKSIALREFTVRYNRLAEIISDTPGVLDFSSLTLNGQAENADMPNEHSFPRRDPVTFT